MKKKIFVLSVITVILLSVSAGCGNKVVCDYCGQEKICESKTVFGEETHICKDCSNDLNELVYG